MDPAFSGLEKSAGPAARAVLTLPPTATEGWQSPVECTRLEIEQTVKRFGGSNPPPSAPGKTVLVGQKWDMERGDRDAP